MEGDVGGDRLLSGLFEGFVGAFDAVVQRAGADAVALAWFVAVAAGEDEVLGLAPAGGELVFAQERDQLGLQVDGADAGLGLGYGDAQDGAGEVDVAPAEVDELGDAQSAGDDRGGEQGAVASGVLEQDLDLLAVQAGAGEGLLLVPGPRLLAQRGGQSVRQTDHTHTPRAKSRISPKLGAKTSTARWAGPTGISPSMAPWADVP